MIINQQNLNGLKTAFTTAFNASFRDAPSDYDKVATSMTSTTQTQSYNWLGQFPQLREWVGDRVLRDVTQHNYTIRNKKYEATVAVSRDDIEDDQYAVYMPLMQELGFSAKRHPDQLVFSLLARGRTEKCYDGKPFFATDHPVGRNKKNATSNVDSGGSGSYWYLLDAMHAIKPLILQERRPYELTTLMELQDEGVFLRDEYRYGVNGRCNVGFGFWQQAYASNQTLDATNFNAAMEAMMAFKSDAGNPLGIMPSILVVAPSLRSEAKEVLQREYVNGGESNINYQAVDLLITNWLS